MIIKIKLCIFNNYVFSTINQIPNLLQTHSLISTESHEIEKSLAILSSFKFDHTSLVSLISDCPGVLDFEFLEKWEQGLSILRGLGGSSLMIRRVLEHSRRFEIDPDEVFVIVEALRGLGFKDRTLCRVLEKFPGVVLMSKREIANRVEFLVGFGVPRNGIDRVVCCFPWVLGFGVEDRLRPLLCEFRGFGFGDEAVRREIFREPRILGVELCEISRCLEWLRTLKCREAIKERILSKGEFRAGFEVKLRVECLCRHGLIRREAFEVLWKEPRAIVYNVKDVERKIEFLTNKMRFGIGCLVEVPEYLGVNYEKQIVPRFNVIEHLRSKGGLGCEVDLKGLIKPSRLKFYNLYVKPYPECEKIFGRFSGDSKVQNQHSAGLWKLFKPPSYPKLKHDVKNTKQFMESLGHWLYQHDFVR